MKQIILDTNEYVAFKRGDPDTVAIIQHVDIIGLTPIIIGELLAGFAIGTKEKQNRQALNDFLSSNRVVIYPIDENTAIYYGHVYAFLRSKGTPILSNDLWIGARDCRQFYYLGRTSSIFCAPKLIYWVYTPLRYSKINELRHNLAN